MVHLEIKRCGGHIEREDARNTTIETVFRRHKLTAGVVAHRVKRDVTVAVFVHLRNQVFKRQRFECFAVALHPLVTKFFSNFQPKRVIVLEVPITCGKVQP